MMNYACAFSQSETINILNEWYQLFKGVLNYSGMLLALNFEEDCSKEQHPLNENCYEGNLYVTVQ